MNEIVYILLSTYNRAHLIEETLDSIKQQTYVNFKCFVIDDNSTDATAQTVKKYSSNDDRFKYFLKPSQYEQGLPQSRNYGLDLASKYGAKYLQFFDDDDIMHPCKLQYQMECFASNPQLQIVNCQYSGFRDKDHIDFEKSDKEISVSSSVPWYDFLFKKIKINSCGPMLKWDLVANFRFDEELKFFAEEEDFYLRILFKEKPLYDAVCRPLFYYRHHSQSITANQENRIQKVGTGFILDQKMWDFLEGNDLLDKKLIAHYIKRFSIDHYNASYLKKVHWVLKHKFSKGNSNFKFKAILKLNVIYRKVFFRILKS